MFVCLLVCFLISIFYNKSKSTTITTRKDGVKFFPDEYNDENDDNDEDDDVVDANDDDRAEWELRVAT